ncbi:MAG: acetyl-CoA C-acetyltransferase, partial [Pseudomonadales bacterium]
MSDIYIAAGARTPMGAFQGSLADASAVELGTTAIRQTITRAGIDAANINEVIMGCVLPAGLRQGPARQAAISSGIPVEVGATTINKLCGSGMKALMLAHDLIKAGTKREMIAGGMESMTNSHYLLA